MPPSWPRRSSDRRDHPAAGRFARCAASSSRSTRSASSSCCCSSTGAILKPDTFPTWDNVRNMLTQASVVGRARDRHDVRHRDRGHRPVGGLDGRRGRDVRRHPGRPRRPRACVFILGAIGFATAARHGQRDRHRLRPRGAVHRDARDVLDRPRARAAAQRQAAGRACSTSTAARSATPAPFSLLWFGTGRILGIPVSVYVFIAITIARLGPAQPHPLRPLSWWPSAATARRRASPASRCAGSSSASTCCPGCSPASRPCCCAPASAAPRRSAETSTSSTRSAPSSSAAPASPAAGPPSSGRSSAS